MKPIFTVEHAERSVWRIVRTYDGQRNTVHMTGCRLEAQRMRDELERADKRAFYEGLLIGRAEGEILVKAAAA